MMFFRNPYCVNSAKCGLRGKLSQDLELIHVGE